MTAAVGEIAVIVGSDITPLQTGLNQASSRLDRFGNDLKKSAKQLAAWGAAGASAAAALTAAMVKMSADSASELLNLSRVAGENVERFQELALASNQLGIDQDKLSDILKDVNDKMGDFLDTGAGPMVDFFENIAPKIGVTAKEFEGLSSSQVLGKYISSLQEANVSQQQMTFYMEAIASDSTALIPLFEDNAAAIAEMTRQAEEFGLVSSEFDLARLDKMNEKLDLVGKKFEAVATIISAELAPFIEAAADIFLEMTKNSEDTRNAVQKVVDKVLFLADAVVGVKRVFETLGKGVGAIAFTMVQGLKVVGLGVENLANKAKQVFAIIKLAAMNAVNAIAGGAIDGVNAAIEALNKLPKVDLELLDRNLIDTTELEKAVDKLKSEAPNIEAELEKISNNVGMAWSDVSATLLKQLPSSIIREKITEIKEENEQLLNDLQTKTDEANNMEQEKQRAHLATLAEQYSQYQRATTEETQAAIDARNALEAEERQNKIQLAQRVFAGLSTLMQTENKKLFAIGKAAAAANIIVDTIQASMSSYKWASTWGGPIAGGIAAAATAASGAAALAQLASTNIGSSSVPSTSQGGGQAATQAVQAQQAPSVLTVQGINANQFYSGEQLAQLAEELLEFQRQGGEVVLT